MKKNQPTVFILSVSSGIGCELAKRYLRDGWRVIGTYRQKKYVGDLLKEPNCTLIACDINKKKDVSNLTLQFKRLKLNWNTFISSVGVLQPLSRFFDVDFDQWNEAVHTNSIEQLRVLHALYPYRQKNGMSNVVFFAGSGTNNVVVHMSSYITSKIMLIKMCEFLDAENKDLNVFIVGPGWTRTKAHLEILADKNTPKEKYIETKDFLDNRQGTDFEEIYKCIETLSKQGKQVASGRNFSVVHDAWRENNLKWFIEELKSDENMYKLRRFKNELKPNNFGVIARSLPVGRQVKRRSNP